MAVEHLSAWICGHYAYADALTHLKLQKLFFYSYGALLALDLEHELGSPLTFEPWDHGPVNRALYRNFRLKGAEPISPQECGQAPAYPEPVARTLNDSLTIYGAMDAWSLRNQSHLEQPWKNAYQNKDQEINPGVMKQFFKMKYSDGSVAAPEYLFGLNSFKIDRIPVQNYPDLHGLAEAVRRVFPAPKHG